MKTQYQHIIEVAQYLASIGRIKNVANMTEYEHGLLEHTVYARIYRGYINN